MARGREGGGTVMADGEHPHPFTPYYTPPLMHIIKLKIEKITPQLSPKFMYGLAVCKGEDSIYFSAPLTQWLKNQWKIYYKSPGQKFNKLMIF